MVKYLILLLFVYSVSAVTSFIEEGKRAKLFELTDDEISVFKITIPDDEYKALIDKCQYTNTANVEWSNVDVENTDEFRITVSEDDSYKTKNATLSVEIQGEKKSFKKVTLSLGGHSARSYGRTSFNIKIRGNKDLYGRSQFRLRSDARDATTIRSKLACDIHNRLGLVSISANYVSLYINDDYMGLFVLMDAPKLSWAKLVYDDENTTHLYKCKECNNADVESSATKCVNENEEITENTEWIEFLTTLDNAQSAEDIEDIFDVDQFLYEIAYEYLSGSWDHFLFNGHNYSVYKVKNGKWTVILYDFDADLGQDAHYICIYPHQTDSTDYPSYSFNEFIYYHQHLIDILILRDPSRFNAIIKDFVKKAFNPTILFPRIDELKDLIRSEKIKEKTPDENGNIPGLINKSNTFDYSLEQWDANSEFTMVSNNSMNTAYGLKYWILMRYRFVCKAYDIECDPLYMDENYQFSINKNVESHFEEFDSKNDQPPQQNVTSSSITDEMEKTTSVDYTVTITSTFTTTRSIATATSIVIDSDTTEYVNDNEIEVEVNDNEIDNDSDTDSI
ncbi:hypothetical protein PIROE2DRAFT_10020 [Piromyces sp. E2]|nr:hypothetical protein PIROE2DRAFT_10020 [Piromyces sp. E2]|eukprot:OUM63423.1 hypothetical protein PIROE2DRAFT_10020 [Piromyces sp. E2]